MRLVMNLNLEWPFAIPTVVFILFSTAVTGCKGNTKNPPDNETGDVNRKGVDPSRKTVQLKTENHGTLEGKWILEVNEAKKEKRIWHKSTVWKAYLESNGNSDKSLPAVRLELHPPMDTSHLSKEYKLVGYPKYQEPRVTLYSRQGNRYDLSGPESDLKGSAGRVNLKVDSQTISGQIRARLAHGDDPERLERRVLKGELQGKWVLKCFKVEEEHGFWTRDPRLKSDYCRKISETLSD